MKSHHDRHWQSHPAIRTGNQLTFGERAADFMRSGMGSWAFLGGFIAFMGCWAITNAILNGKAFDPFPYILLNLFLSMLAGLQGAILLIAGKRQDAIQAALAEHDRHVMNEMHEILAELRKPE